MSSFDGKVAFVTGGGRGQGREIALEFARRGADVAILDIAEDIAGLPYSLATKEDLAETCSLVEGLGRRCVSFVGDVRSQRDLDAAAAGAVAELGRIDYLIANAGIYDWSSSPVWETSDESWNNQIGVCLEGVWRSLKAVVPHILAHGGGGAIVVTSSNLAVEAVPFSVAYVTAKHGVIGIMRTAALELASLGVRVNALLPSTTDTKINDHQAGWTRTSGKPDGTREDYLEAVHQWTAMRNTGVIPPSAQARAAVWLCSDDADYVTGIQLPVDAGHLVLPGFNPWPVRD